jgi:hypothetical protein
MLQQRSWTVLKTARGFAYLYSSVPLPKRPNVPPCSLLPLPRSPIALLDSRPFSQATFTSEKRLGLENDISQAVADDSALKTPVDSRQPLTNPASTPSPSTKSRTKRRKSEDEPSEPAGSYDVESTHLAAASRSLQTHQTTPTRATTTPTLPHKRSEPWQAQKAAVSRKLDGAAWLPRKRLSPEALDGLRALHASDPARFSTAALATQFEVSPEAVRRILRSRWRPSEEEQEARLRRWDRRGRDIWEARAEQGAKPPRRWRVMGVGRVGKGKVPRWKRRQGGGESAAGARDTDRVDEDVPWEDEMPGSAGVSGEREIQQRVMIGDRIV